MQQGDTFERIARKVYGDAEQQSRIARANPGSQEPLTPGIILSVPLIPGAPKNKAFSGVSDGVNECAVVLNNKRFRFWEFIRITRSIDSIDSVEFEAPFDPTDQDQQNAFKPFTYPPLEVTVGGDKLFTGVSMGPSPRSDDTNKIVFVGGYARAGVLQDCTIPASAFPLEYNDQNLEQIAQDITKHFGIRAVFDADPGSAFERVRCDYNRRALDFLMELAVQRGLVMGSDENGDLVFRKSVVGDTPIASLSEGVPPLVSVEAFFDHQQYYSHVTGIEPVVVGATGAQFTAKNPRLRGVVRPHTFQVKDVLGGDVRPATEAKLGRMFGNMASYSVTVASWRDPSGALWAPNAVVSLRAPGAMVYSAYSFIVRSVIFEKDPDSELAVLDLVLPGAFSGGSPERLPWE